MLSYVIIQVQVEKGEVWNHRELEEFPSYREAGRFLETHYKTEGNFWTGMFQYKIIVKEGIHIRGCYDCNDLHQRYLEASYP